MQSQYKFNLIQRVSIKGSYFAFNKDWISAGEGGCADFCSLVRDGSVRREKNHLCCSAMRHEERQNYYQWLVIRQWA